MQQCVVILSHLETQSYESFSKAEVNGVDNLFTTKRQGLDFLTIGPGRIGSCRKIRSLLSGIFAEKTISIIDGFNHLVALSRLKETHAKQ